MATRGGFLRWGRRKVVWQSATTAVIVALIAGIAVIVQGFSVQEVPVNSSSVWVMQSGSGQRYGQVNTSIRELDGAYPVNEPSQVVETRSGLLVFAGGNSTVAAVDAGLPPNLTDNPALFHKTPAETQVVASGSDIVAYLGANGSVSVSSMVDGQLGDAVQATPATTGPAADGAAIVFRAVAVSAEGEVYVYSPNDGGRATVRRFDPQTNSFVGSQDVRNGPQSGTLQLSVIGESWVLFDADTGKLWVPGHDVITVPTSMGIDGRLQVPALSGDFVYVATDRGLVSVPLTGDPIATQVSTASGIPTAPRAFDGSVYAAWLPEEGTEGTLYNANTDESKTLSYNGKNIPRNPLPMFQANEHAIVLNDTMSGWTWTIPDGQLVVSSQDWSLTDLTPDQTSEDAEVTEVTVPKKPVAEGDVFGVRAGAVTNLPVLLNDHDANDDVLTVIPSSLSGVDGAGSISVTDNGGLITVSVPADAAGSISFTYAVTDGTTNDGLNSDPAPVTLNIVSPDDNSAPMWCADYEASCLQKWPDVQVASQSTVTIPFLAGWVDPEGDEFFIDSVTNEAALGTVGITPDGSLIYRAPNVTEAVSVNLQVHVSDVRGASATRSLRITVSPEPTLSMTSFAVTTAVDERITVDVASHVMGGNGTIAIEQLDTLTLGAPVELAKSSNTQFAFSSSQVGQYVVTVVVGSGEQTVKSKVRVTVIDPATGSVTTEPVSVFLTPSSDTVIDVLSATMNPTGRALVPTQIQTQPSTGASLFADPISNGNIRVRGTTADGLPGLIGFVTYVVSDGSGEAQFTATGQASVYLLPEPASQAPVGMDDHISVRTGAQLDIDVLANDAGPAGAVLDLAPGSVTCTGAEQALVFAANGIVRILAPTKPGTIACSYSLFVRGNPTSTGQANLTVTITDPTSNRPPQPPTLHGRVSAGGNVVIPFDMATMDPDGESVTLIGLGVPSQGFAAMTNDRSGLVYTSLPSSLGQDSFEYTVRDASGETGTGTVRVGIVSEQPEPGPVTVSDYVEVATGKDSKVVVQLTDNDYDPLGQGLTLVKVAPNRETEDAIYTEWNSHLGDMTERQITVTGAADAMTMLYTYTVKDADGNLATGNMVVRVTDSGAQTYPVVTDTYLSFEDLAQLGGGIDVITNHVAWGSGDVGTLKLSLVRSTGSYSVSGSRISGSAPVDGDLVAFQLDGTDFNGVAVKTYGFMHVPSQVDALLSLDPNAARRTVTEGEPQTWDMKTLLKLPPSMNVEVDGANIESLGLRAEGTCSSAGGTTFTYSPGKGKPWDDGCVVPARLAGSADYTKLLVPITVIPLNPEPELSSRKLTITPGKLGTQKFDLREMTKWPGKTQADIDALSYSFDYSGADFEISQQGSVLTIMALTSSQSGTKNEAVIRVLDHSGTEPAPLVLVVGDQPNAGPVGGSIAKICQANTGSCVINKSEMRGFFNPYGSTPPDFAPFGYRGGGGTPDYGSETNYMMCGTARLVANPTTITATWDATKGMAGISCPNITYLVVDDDYRYGNGSLNFTIEGPPAAPAGARQTGYTDNSVTITISPGAAGQASPPLLGYKIYMEDGSSTDCPVSAGRESFDVTCEFGGLDPYDGTNERNRHTFKIVPRNSIGESGSYVTVSNAYAYVSPLPIGPEVIDAAETVYVPGVTSATVGAVKMTITPVADNMVSRYRIQGEGQPEVVQTVSGSTPFTISNIRAGVGLNSRITITALGRVDPPVAGQAQTSSTTWAGRVAGSPSVATLTQRGSPQQTNGVWEATLGIVNASRNFSDAPGSYAVVMWESTLAAAPTCVDQTETSSVGFSPTDSDAVFGRALDETPGQVGSSVWSTDVTFTGLKPMQSYKTMVCYSNAFGTTKTVGADVSTLADPGAGEFTYAVNRNANASGEWLAKLSGSPTIPAGLYAEFTDNNWTTVWRDDIFSTSFPDSDPVYKVRYCLAANNCSRGDALVAPSDPSRMRQMKIATNFLVDGSGAQTTACTYDEGLTFGASGAGIGTSANPLWQVTDVDATPAPQFQIAGGAWTDMVSDGFRWVIPSDANPDGASVSIHTFVRGISVGGRPTSGLDGYYQTPAFTVTCRLAP